MMLPACANSSGVSCAVGAVPGCQVPQVWDTHGETCFQRALAWGGVSVFQPRPSDISTRPLSSSSGERKKKIINKKKKKKIEKSTLFHPLLL